jgi:hypothetical protein
MVSKHTTTGLVHYTILAIRFSPVQKSTGEKPTAKMA